MNDSAFLVEMQAFPSIAYLHLIANAEFIIIEASENYNKRSYRNRFDLMNADGVRHCTIPLRKGKNNGLSIRSVEISFETHWQKELWSSFHTMYKSAPYFDHYKSLVRSMIFQNEKKLLDYNHNNLGTILEVLRVDTPVSWSISYQKLPSVIDLREQIRPNSCIGGIDYAQGYQTDVSGRANISCLDLLMHMGPESELWIKNCSLYSIPR